ncbi:MAG TPA: hypothetical protein VHQ86_02405, partial [Candidatus Saccharimonadia bacterium]|nr:hypothetical protein [Candidatus Saccharimonadia bacterium]
GEVFVPIPSGQKGVIFDKVTTTNPSATCASSTATIGVYTATAAGGTTIVTAATGTHTSLTAATKYTDCTVAASADALVLSQQTTGTNAGFTGVLSRSPVRRTSPRPLTFTLQGGC